MNEDLTPPAQAQLRAENDNYKAVMTGFGVDPTKLFGTLAISTSELFSFMAVNPGITGVRIYISKKTADPGADDYQLVFVPCMEVTDASGTWYDDVLVIPPGVPSKVKKSVCKKPPGCPFGAKFNP